MGWRRYVERNRRDEDLTQEITSYIEHETDENVARGMSAEEARRAAQRKFGNSTLVREAVYEMNTLTFLESVWLDFKHAFRELRKSKTFLATALATLALCIGANVAIFSVVNSVIFRPLPVPEPDRIVMMGNVYPRATGAASPGLFASNSAPDFFDRRALGDVFEEVAAFDQESYNVSTAAEPRRVGGFEVTPSFFSVLKVTPAIGRVFAEVEGEPGRNHVVVLSHGLWQELYGADPAVLGRDLELDGQPHTVVGVMPAGFMFIDPDVRLWTPEVFSPEERRDYHDNSWGMVARLRPAVTLAQAQAQIDALNARNMGRMPELKPLLVDAGFHTPIRLLQDELVREIRRVLFLLWGGVTCVLLIGAVNVANLVLVRATAHERELATRVALGAPRRRVIGLVLTESLLLAALGGLLGLFLGWAALRGLHALSVETLPRADEIRLDGTVVAFTVALALGVGLLVGLFPAVRVLRVSAVSVLREEGRSGTAGRGIRRVRRGLVVTQIAMALVLLVAGGSLLASFRQLLAIDPGFQPAHVLTAAVNLPATSYPNEASVRAFVDRALTELQALPTVEAAGITRYIPFGDFHPNAVIFAEGHVAQPRESVIAPERGAVTPGYFDSMGIPIIEGRDFESRDQVGSHQVIIIDEQLAQRFFPKEDALGQRLWQPVNAEGQQDLKSTQYFDIIGIVATIRRRSVLLPDQNGAYYLPFMRNWGREFVFSVRTTGDASALVGPVRKVIAEIDAGLPLYDIRTMEERMARSLTDRRTAMLLTAGFGALALLLAAVGIYGVLASLVQQRTREIGIRMALGSDGAAIFRLILREGAVMLGFGVILGLAGAIALRHVIEGHVYGVSPLDPEVLGLVVLLMNAATLAACLIPACRATRVDPASALAEP